MTGTSSASWPTSRWLRPGPGGDRWADPMQVSARLWRHFDVWLLAAVAVLTIAGVAMIGSAIGGNENLAELVPRQVVFAVIGLAVVLVTAPIDYRFWTALVRPLYLVTVAALALVLVAGFVGFGSARWFNVGIAYIQPTELAKVMMILVMADFFARHRQDVGQTQIILSSLIRSEERRGGEEGRYRG